MTRTSRPAQVKVSPPATCVSMPGMLRGLSGGPDDGAAEMLFQRQVALDVISMVMRVEDVSEPPAKAGELPLDFRRIGRIDRGGEAGLLVMQEQAIIVRTADELMESEMNHEGVETFFTIRVIS
jgi:hypothetical protein